MARKKHFEEVKCLFNVSNVEGMKEVINSKLSYAERGFMNSFQAIPSITASIKIDEIAKF